MADLVIHNVPDDLHTWLSQQAQAHHRSVQEEAIVLLENQQKQGMSYSSKPSAEEIMAMARQCAELPELDKRDANAILGYDERGLPC